MRNLTQHIVPGDSVNHQLEILVRDEPGSGGACHKYTISAPIEHADFNDTDIDFQNGPIKEAGVNGLTHEVLLAILIDRMEGFQAGRFANINNADALLNLRAALYFLQLRTRERIARNVEGTHEK